MTRNEIAKALSNVAEGAEFITAAQLTRALGRTNPKRIKAAYLKGLAAVDGKYYLIREVATVLKERCTA